MSIQAVAWVLENSESRGTARLVLIALANRANPDHNWECWPAMRGLAKEAGVASTSTVHSALATLVDLAEIKIVSPGDARHPGRYRMTFMQRSVGEHSSVREANAASSPERTQRSAQTEQNRNEPELNRNSEPNGSVPSSRKKTNHPDANRVTRAWWDQREEKPLQPFVAVLGMVDKALKAGWDAEHVQTALASVSDDPPVVTWKLEKALAATRRRTPKPGDPDFDYRDFHPPLEELPPAEPGTRRYEMERGHR